MDSPSLIYMVFRVSALGWPIEFQIKALNINMVKKALIKGPTCRQANIET